MIGMDMTPLGTPFQPPWADIVLMAAQVRCEASGVLVAKDKAVRRFVVRAPCRSTCALPRN